MATYTVLSEPPPLSITHHQDAETLLEQLSEAVDTAYDFPPERTTSLTRAIEQSNQRVLEGIAF